MRAAILDSCFGLHLDLARSKHGMNLSSGLKRRQSNLSPAGQLLKPWEAIKVVSSLPLVGLQPQVTMDLGLQPKSSILTGIATGHVVINPSIPLTHLAFLSIW